MDFYSKAKSWYDKLPSERNYEEGALLMLQITHNRIQYNNVMRALDRHHDIVEWTIGRYIKEHLDEDTKREVRDMREQVRKIASKRNLDGTAPSHAPSKGKRSDHDSLPDEIKAFYHENLTILQSMRDLQTQLRIIARDPNVVCLDSEQYPFLKELIEKDKRLRDNWVKYDTWTAEGEAEAIAVQDAKNASLKALRLLNMYKGKYKKAPSDDLKSKILEQLKLVMSPSQKLIDELKELGINE